MHKKTIHFSFLGCCFLFWVLLLFLYFTLLLLWIKLHHSKVYHCLSITNWFPWWFLQIFSSSSQYIYMNISFFPDLTLTHIRIQFFILLYIYIPYRERKNRKRALWNTSRCCNRIKSFFFYIFVIWVLVNRLNFGLIEILIRILRTIVFMERYTVLIISYLKKVSFNSGQVILTLLGFKFGTFWLKGVWSTGSQIWTSSLWKIFKTN